jgi:hypothetical protein
MNGNSEPKIDAQSFVDEAIRQEPDFTKVVCALCGRFGLPFAEAHKEALAVRAAMLKRADDVIAECGGDSAAIRKLFVHYVYKSVERDIKDYRRCENIDTENLPNKASDDVNSADTDWAKALWTLLAQFFQERGYEREFRYLQAGSILFGMALFDRGSGKQRAPHRTHVVLADALLISEENSRQLMRRVVKVFEEFCNHYSGG